MEPLRVSLLFSLLSTLLQLVKGQSCTSQVSLDSINSNELLCQGRQDCTGLECFNQNSFLREFVNLFEIRPLPCATPSPVLWLQVLGEEDPTNNNRRNVFFNVTWNSTTIENLNVTSGDLSFGIYQFSVNFSTEAGSSIGFAVQLTRRGVTTWVVNNTVIPLDTSSCSVQTTTTTQGPLMTGTTTMRSPSASDIPITTNDSRTDTPTSMNTYTSSPGTASGSHPIPEVVLNFILVLLTMLMMTALVA